jgi:hypothetical protein
VLSEADTHPAFTTISLQPGYQVQTWADGAGAPLLRRALMKWRLLFAALVAAVLLAGAARYEATYAGAAALPVTGAR